MENRLEKQWTAEDYYNLAGRELDKSYRADEEINLAASTGTNDLEFEQVKSGRVLVIEALSARDDTSAPTRIRLGYRVLGTFFWIKTVPAPITTESIELDRQVRLREGMRAVARIEGATSGDDIYAILLGYWIEVKRGG